MKKYSMKKKLIKARSIGSIEYGNNNIFEIMRDQYNEVVLSPHGEDPGTKHSDGSWDCEGITVADFIRLVADRPDFHEIMSDLRATLAKG